MAKTNQAPGGVQQYLERSAAPTAQHPNVGPDPTPPALPPKTRKSKVLEAPKVSEHSDRGDSDMDEETYSSSQEKQKVKKVCLFLNGLILMDSLLLYIALGSQLGAPFSIIHRIVSSSRNFLTLMEQNMIVCFLYTSITYNLMLGTTNCLFFITFACHCIYTVNERLHCNCMLHDIPCVFSLYWLV